MDKVLSTKAIVLRKKNWRESDLLFSFYTKEHGKVEAVATGARKLKSKLVGHLSGLGVIELVFVRGRKVNRITHAYLIKKWEMKEADDLNYISSLFEIVEKATQTESQSEKMWFLFLWAMEELNSSQEKNRKRFILNLFILKLLLLLGYDMRTNNCVKCGNEISEVRRFSFVNHGFVCGKCRGGEINVTQSNFEIIKQIQEKKDIAELKIAPDDNDALFVFLRRYLIYFLEKEIVSLQFV